MDIQNNLEAVGTGTIFVAAVMTALGLMFNKARKGLRTVRLKFAEQISDVVFRHPSFLHIDTKVDELKHEVGKNRKMAEQAKHEVIEVRRELTLNGGASIKDKVNSTHEAVSGLSQRLGNVEQQLKVQAIDSVKKAQEGGRRHGDHPHNEPDVAPHGDFGP